MSLDSLHFLVPSKPCSGKLQVQGLNSLGVSHDLMRDRARVQSGRTVTESSRAVSQTGWTMDLEYSRLDDR